MSIYESLRIYDSSKTTPLELDRLGYLTDSAKGKDVLHVGCSDWPVTEERIRSGDLLHLRLRKSAKRLTGIDLSDAGIQIMRSPGIENVELMNAEDITIGQQFDMILAGDVLEHLNNPGLFLAKASELLRPDGELVIAVPSALTFANVLAWLRKREQVHKDHTFYYSPKTLSTLCGRYDLLPVKLIYTAQPASSYESKLFVWIRKTILTLLPNAAPAIIMRFKKSQYINKKVFLSLP